MEQKRLTRRPPLKLRIYQTPTGPRVYFNAANLDAATVSDVGRYWERRARHIEAVHKSGRARVLKCADGMPGYLDATTEGQPVPPKSDLVLELEAAARSALRRRAKKAGR